MYFNGTPGISKGNSVLQINLKGDSNISQAAAIAACGYVYFMFGVIVLTNFSAEYIIIMTYNNRNINKSRLTALLN